VARPFVLGHDELLGLPARDLTAVFECYGNPLDPDVPDVLREESEKTPMAKKVYASFTKFQELVGPWDMVSEGAHHQYVIR